MEWLGENFLGVATVVILVWTAWYIRRSAAATEEAAKASAAAASATAKSAEASQKAAWGQFILDLSKMYADEQMGKDMVFIKRMCSLASMPERFHQDMADSGQLLLPRVRERLNAARRRVAHYFHSIQRLLERDIIDRAFVKTVIAPSTHGFLEAFLTPLESRMPQGDEQPFELLRKCLSEEGRKPESKHLDPWSMHQMHVDLLRSGIDGEGVRVDAREGKVRATGREWTITQARPYLDDLIELGLMKERAPGGPTAYVPPEGGSGRFDPTPHGRHVVEEG